MRRLSKNTRASIKYLWHKDYLEKIVDPVETKRHNVDGSDMAAAEMVDKPKKKVKKNRGRKI